MDRVVTVISTPLYEAGLDQKTMYIALRDDATDAAPELRPLQPVNNGDTNDVDYYEEAGNKLNRLWRTKLGKYLYDYVVKEDLKKEGIRRAFLPLLCSQGPPLTCSPYLQFSVPYPPDEIILVSFPKHYTLWVHKKGNPTVPRTDTYLHGES